MSKLAFPAILVATVMVAGIFAFMPVEQASTVHTTIGVLNTATANDLDLPAAVTNIIDLTSGSDIAVGTICASITDATGDDSLALSATAAAGEPVIIIAEAAGVGTEASCEEFATQLLTVNAATVSDADVLSYSVAWRQAAP